MALVGLSALIYQVAARPGDELDADVETLDRDLALLHLLFFAAGLLGFGVLRRGARDPDRDRLRRSPTGSTSRATLRGGGDGPGGGDDRAAVHGPDAGRPSPRAGRSCSSSCRPRRDRRRRPPVRRGAARRRRGDRRRAARPLARPRAAGDRAAREGQQLLLGPRGQGQPRARQHHRGDGLPVHDPDRDRARVHRVGPRSLRRRLAAPSASPAARSPTGRCGCAAASSWSRS